MKLNNEDTEQISIALFCFSNAAIFLLFCFQYHFCVFGQCIIFINLHLDSYPSINLSKHCGNKVPNFATLLSCPSIGTAIKQCQENKKQVFISIGGATEGYVNNINNAERAKEFATRIWNLFLGGKATPSYRPFGEYGLLFYSSENLQCNTS